MLQPSVALGIAVLTVACSGCGDPAGEIGVNGTRTGRVAAHEWLCAVEFAGTDTFVAHLTPCFLSLELREGGCHADGAVLGSSSTGTLIVALAPEFHGYNVQIGNPTDESVEYSLGVSYQSFRVD